MRFPAALACSLLAATISVAVDDVEFPDEPFGLLVEQAEVVIAPGVIHYTFVLDDPMWIHVVEIDLAESGARLGVALGHDTVTGTETVRSMANRHGALVAINGDYWGPHGVPQGLTIVEGELVIAPKHRTAFAVNRDGVPEIGIWEDGWSWDTRLIAPDGSDRQIPLMNSDCADGWLCLYTGLYGRPSLGDSVSPVTEIVVDENDLVVEVRTDQPGIEIPRHGFVVTGRGEAGEWLRERFEVGSPVEVDIRTSRPIDNLETAIGAGPRILKDGEFFQDPLAEFPHGEEFTLAWKRGHYLERQPRSAIGISADRGRVFLVTIDGRTAEHSIGIHQKQLAELFVAMGASDAMDLDSGGSATLVIRGEVVNKPSDRARPDGSGGRERAVSNALLVFVDARDVSPSEEN